MRFRNLLAAISVFVAVSFTSLSFSAQPKTSSPPTVFVRGLLMLQLEQKDGLHITLPDAPGHKDLPPVPAFQARDETLSLTGAHRGPRPGSST